MEVLLDEELGLVSDRPSCVKAAKVEIGKNVCRAVWVYLGVRPSGGVRGILRKINIPPCWLESRGSRKLLAPGILFSC